MSDCREQVQDRNQTKHRPGLLQEEEEEEEEEEEMDDRRGKDKETLRVKRRWEGRLERGGRGRGGGGGGGGGSKKRESLV